MVSFFFIFVDILYVYKGVFLVPLVHVFLGVQEGWYVWSHPWWVI